MKRISSLPLLLFFWLLNTNISDAEVKLPAVMGDHMVLQQQMEVPIWGWAAPGEQVKVKAGWQQAEVATSADENGKWMVKVHTPPAGGPFEMIISGQNSITLKNILAGEVWVCSGQSNMAMTVVSGYNKGVVNRDQEVAAAKYPQIRLFTVRDQDVPEPAADCQGSWVECNPETVGSFSATGYFFGREIYQQLDVPIGLIHASAGGSVIETWCSQEVLKSDPDFFPVFDYGVNYHRMNASGLYNGMIAPLIPFGMRGVVWYQGESNSVNAYTYRKLFPAMIRGWREAWGQGEFPFYYAQISPWVGYGEKPISAELREAQLLTLAVPNTGMAVTMDVEDVNEIHPLNKQVVGKRLALWALAKTYGKKDIVYSGPLYKSMKIEGDKVRLYFDHVDGGLICKGEMLTEFTIAGADQNFVPAQAVIEGDTILVSSEKVKEPVAVRMGWGNAAVPNLFNRADLPASPFRTDDWPLVTADKNWREKLK